MPASISDLIKQYQKSQMPLESTAEDDRLMQLVATNLSKQTPAGANMLEVARTTASPSPFDLLETSGLLAGSQRAPAKAIAARALAAAPQVDMGPINEIAQGAKKAKQQGIYDQLMTAQSQALESQRAGVGNLEKLVKEYQDKIKKQGTRTNLAPFLALADFAAGTNLSQTYQAPKDRSLELIQLEKALQKERGALTGKELDLLKTQLAVQLKRDKMATGVGSLTKGQEALDKEFAKDYAKYYAGGGYADSLKGIQQLRDVINTLKSGKDVTGGTIGYLPDAFVSLYDPEAVSAKETVEEVVQRNLRLILGAQFTEKEGERLIARAYNPRLDEKTNLERVERLLNQMEQAANSKAQAAEYFEQFGTLKGYQGSRFHEQFRRAEDFDLGDVKASGAGQPQAFKVGEAPWEK